ncbi:MAG: hypothetical protein N3E46_01285 [Gemmataceae bacterium]|mgnify:CR=1 FL=1|uniref:Uncharacterized protein n=1 Tax=Thermogemmata fonticola TaxID=2755323 RepID=A0A7V8VH15_9BACT|nr:hypothetical protein [Thermogemmata fonticola]MBA2227777.1 hypothetical protein [Thermogemmata fonticola]MCX8138301.1 hypothetical protein [Gemmataceae bacterium]
MLRYVSAEQLLAEPSAHRYLHVLILTALQDGASRLELRYTLDGVVPYYRLEERDWELAPPPPLVAEQLKETVRQVSRLVTPERPDTTVLVGPPEGRYEPLQAGWLTYELQGRWLDLRVYIDPREPFGVMRFDIEGASEFSSAAQAALRDYAEQLAALQDSISAPEETLP